jgi:hypothetical protein
MPSLGLGLILSEGCLVCQVNMQHVCNKAPLFTLWISRSPPSSHPCLLACLLACLPSSPSGLFELGDEEFLGASLPSEKSRERERERGEWRGNGAAGLGLGLGLGLGSGLGAGTHRVAGVEHSGRRRLEGEGGGALGLGLRRPQPQRRLLCRLPRREEIGRSCCGEVFSGVYSETKGTKGKGKC